MTTSPDKAFWFNTVTANVEQGLKSPGTDRLGPFESYAEAAQALEIVRARAKKWAEEDVEDEQRRLV